MKTRVIMFVGVAIVCVCYGCRKGGQKVARSIAGAVREKAAAKAEEWCAGEVSPGDARKMVNIYNELAKCARCNGTGLAQCSNCNGKGTILMPNGWGQNVPWPCPNCIGRNWPSAIRCPDCGGTGRK